MANAETVTDHVSNIDKLLPQYCRQHDKDGIAETKQLLSHEINSMSSQELLTASKAMKSRYDEDTRALTARANSAVRYDCGALDCDGPTPVSMLPTMRLVEDSNKQIKGVNLDGTNCEPFIKYEPDASKDDSQTQVRFFDHDGHEVKIPNLDKFVVKFYDPDGHEITKN